MSLKSTNLQFLSLALSGLIAVTASAQTFQNANSRLQVAAFNSGVTITVVDVNGDGLDDIVRLDQGHDLYIEYQKTGYQFTRVHIADFASGSSWGMCVADVDHNGIKDVVAGGTGSMQLMRLNATGTGLLGSIYTIPNSSFFLQNVNFMDVNNDGWEDIFACDDNAESHVFLNNGAGSFAASTIINFDVSPTDDSGNYGSVWTDFDNDGDLDLYIAKCRQGVTDPNDERRINVLFVNNGNGTYTEMGGMYGLRIGAQSWTANFSDIDNDGDLDALVTNHDVPSQILENDGTGHYTDITVSTGFVLDITAIQSVMEDFDNDGFVDILVTGSDERYYHNNGNKTFTRINFLFDNNDMESFAIGDLNHDGAIDVYAGYASIYTNPTSIDDVIWLNNGNNNNFVSVNLKGTLSNEGALGARVEAYGTWGIQIREVHAGESYGTCNTSTCHFGLGTNSVIDSLVIRWPSGTITHLANPSINQFISVTEGGCISPNNTLSSSQPGNSFVLCAGQNLTLTALPGYSYLWSNGDTTDAILVATTGEYNVTIADSTNCAVTSTTVKVVFNPDETPTVTRSGEVSFCEGGSVTLSSSSANAYQWSNNLSSQSIVVDQSGSYTVSIQGTCQQFTSVPVQVDVLAAPVPTAQNGTIIAPGTVPLAAIGNSLTWYDQPVGGTVLGTGPTFTTPFIFVPTTYYVEDAYSYGGATGFIGKTNSSQNAYSSSTFNYSVVFDVQQNCILKTVKVYTDTPGNRIIELHDSVGNVLQSITVYIPLDSSRITLNFILTPGTGYELTTNTAQNNLLLGYDAPRLQRSNSDVTYPYNLLGSISLVNSPAGLQYYYYFYDWEVEKSPRICLSDRIPVLADVSLGVHSLASAQLLSIFPNPASDKLFIQSQKNRPGATSIEFTDISGRSVKKLVIRDMLENENRAITINGMEAGVYFVTVSNSGASSVQRIVIE